MPRRFRRVYQFRHARLYCFNEAAASNAAEIGEWTKELLLLLRSFNEAAASNAAEIGLHISVFGPRDTASMRPRQVMPRR